MKLLTQDAKLGTLTRSVAIRKPERHMCKASHRRIKQQ